jgi:hypothetical protein
VHADDRCGNDTDRNGSNRGRGENRELTTKLLRWSAGPEMVRRRRSTVAGLRHPELDGVDWEPSASIGLTWRIREPRRSFGDARSSSGMLESVKPKLAGVGVCRDLQELERKREEDDD